MTRDILHFDARDNKGPSAEADLEVTDNEDVRLRHVSPHSLEGGIQIKGSAETRKSARRRTDKFVNQAENWEVTMDKPVESFIYCLNSPPKHSSMTESTVG